MLDKKTKEEARKFALKNAIDYGKADERAVLNKMLASDSKLKEKISDVAKLVHETVQEVNKMGKADTEAEFGKYSKAFENDEKKKAGKSAQHNFMIEGAVKGKFATRFPPEPGGYMQIGNAKAAFLDSEFAKYYEGTLALYFDDTNPKKSKQVFVDAFKEDLAWLGINFDKEYYASDHFEIEYKYAEKLVGSGHAYVCSCEIELMKKMRFEGKECKHRDQTKSENLKLWKEMLADKFGDNSVVLRLKGNMSAANTTLRDPVLLRVLHHKHYRHGSKYFLWPTYDFNTPIVDSVEGLTDIFRSKEYELRDELDYMVLDLLGLRKPRIHTFARLEIADNLTSKRKLRALIEEGRVKSWDDPRLVTVAGLRRRGIQPQAIKEFVLRFGMSKTNSTVSIDMLLAENRKMIDGIAKRLFLAQEPIELKVSKVPKEYKSVKLKLHPNKDLGQREYTISDRFLISGKDVKMLKPGAKFRLKDLFNVEVEKIEKKSISGKFIGNDNLDAPKIQWVDADHNVDCKLVHIGPLLVNDEFNKNSLSTSNAKAEEHVNSLQKNEIVQFERVGFFKLDDVKEKIFIGL